MVNPGRHVQTAHEHSYLRVSHACVELSWIAGNKRQTLSKIIYTAPPHNTQTQSPKIPNAQNTQSPKIPKIEIAIPIKYLTAS